MPPYYLFQINVLLSDAVVKRYFSLGCHEYTRRDNFNIWLAFPLTPPSPHWGGGAARVHVPICHIIVLDKWPHCFIKSLLTARRQSPTTSPIRTFRLWTAAPPFAKGRKSNTPLWQRGAKGDLQTGGRF